jgi:hypothetical protein
LRIQRQPLPVGLLADKALGFIGLDVQALYDDPVGPLWKLNIEIL